MDSNQTQTSTRWFLRGRAAFLWAFLICVVGMMISGVHRFTLADSLSQRAAGGIFFGLFFGSFVFAFFAGPIQAVLMLLLYCLKVRRWWWFPLSLIPAGLVFAHCLYFSLNEFNPKSFERTVGVAVPADARLVLAQRGMGGQDRRSLWLFEGDPAGLDRLIEARGWGLIEGDPEQAADIGFRRAKEYFEQRAPWQVDTLYFWMSDKEATEPPFGWNYLLADKERKRWAVWVAD
jgi:hypothetical protein